MTGERKPRALLAMFPNSDTHSDIVWRMKMRSMRARRDLVNNHWDVILGPCPGCSLWQLDYTDDVVMANSTTSNVLEADGSVTVVADLSGFEAMLEGILEEHLAECSGLQELLA